jgi:hypothetical protein
MASGTASPKGSEVRDRQSVAKNSSLICQSPQIETGRTVQCVLHPETRLGEITIGWFSDTYRLGLQNPQGCSILGTKARTDCCNPADYWSSVFQYHINRLHSSTYADYAVLFYRTIHRIDAVHNAKNWAGERLDCQGNCFRATSPEEPSTVTITTTSSLPEPR